ncbi:unnamed protein product [Arabis nemorensis]|uniref:Uncharacterized protein n=1 Tax=Arabis nemorensis TaxID=586526 RepID=A0A565BJ39_9BRAS|nr:unnamed protein product [Arabis nemorensis]
MEEKFHALEGRVSGLESAGYENPTPAQELWWSCLVDITEGVSLQKAFLFRSLAKPTRDHLSRKLFPTRFTFN